MTLTIFDHILPHQVSLFHYRLTGGTLSVVQFCGSVSESMSLHTGCQGDCDWSLWLQEAWCCKVDAFPEWMVESFNLCGVRIDNTTSHFTPTFQSRTLHYTCCMRKMLSVAKWNLFMYFCFYLGMSCLPFSD